jgi:hypothetical protein
MSEPTNKAELLAAMKRAEARKVAEEALPPEAQAFLKALQNRWFPLGKTEDFALIKKMLVEAWTK